MSEKKFLFVLFCTVVTVRLAILFFTVFYDPRGDAIGVFSSDSPTYFMVVENLIKHGVFSMSTDAFPTPDNYRTPGYIFFLYPFMRFTMSFWIISLAQAIIAGGALMVGYVLARR